MKSFIFFFGFFLFSFTFGQEIKIHVKNTEGKNVKLVNVQLIKDDKIKAFTKTNTDGICTFNITEVGEFSLKLTSVFYKTQFLKIDTRNALSYEVTLEGAITQIEAVEIKARPKIARVKNDTISFNLQVIRDNTERYAEDIIRKLPGVNITENGKVTYKGKEVGQVVVEGSDFFGKNHKMATQNLSSEMIEGIELWQNFTTMNGNASTALNLKIKENYKGKITGNIQANYGNKNSYYAHSNLFKISKIGNLAFISDANSIAKDPINLMDFFEMNSQDNIANAENDVQLEVPSFLNNDYKVYNKDNQLGALQFSKVGKNFSVNAFSIFNNSQLNRFTNTNRSLFQNQTLNSYFNEDRTEENRGFIGTSQLKIKKVFGDKSFIFYNFMYNPSEDGFDEDVNRISTTSDFYKINNSLRQSFLSHYLSYNKQINNTKFIFTLQYSKDKQNNFLFINSNSELFQTNNNRLSQTYITKNEKFSVDYFIKSNNRIINFNFHTGFTLKKENAILEDENYSNFETQSIKRYHFTNELNLVKDFNNLEISASIGSHHQNINDKVVDYFDNQFKLKYKPNDFFKSEFTLEYGTKYKVPSIKLLQRNPRYTKELISYQNNNLLPENLSIISNYKLIWNSFDFNKERFTYAFIDYQKSSPHFTNNVTSYNNFSFIENVFGGKEERMLVLVSDERRVLNNFVLESKISYLSIQANNFINFLSNTSENKNLEIYQKFSTKFIEKPIQLDLGYSINKGFYSQSLIFSNSELLNTKLFFGIRANFRKEWIVNILNEYFIQKSAQNTLRNFLIGGQISYQKTKSKIEYNILFNNILNLNSFTYLNSISTPYGLDETSIHSMHGYITGGIKFNF